MKEQKDDKSKKKERDSFNQNRELSKDSQELKPFKKGPTDYSLKKNN